MTYLPLIKRFRYQKVKNLSCLMVILFTLASCGSENNLLKKDALKDLFSFEKLIWYRDADSTIIINKKNLRKIYLNTKTSEDDYFSFLRSYSVRLTTTNERKIAKKFSFSEKTYISAYAVEYLYRCQKKFKKDDPYKNSKFVNRFLLPKYANKYNREFKKHDYYGLKLLKKHHLEHFWEYPEQDTIPSIKRIIE